MGARDADQFIDDHCGAADIFVGDQCMGFSIQAVRKLFAAYRSQSAPAMSARKFLSDLELNPSFEFEAKCGVITHEKLLEMFAESVGTQGESAELRCNCMVSWPTPNGCPVHKFAAQSAEPTPIAQSQEGGYSERKWDFVNDVPAAAAEPHGHKLGALLAERPSAEPISEDVLLSKIRDHIAYAHDFKKGDKWLALTLLKEFQGSRPSAEMPLTAEDVRLERKEWVSQLSILQMFVCASCAGAGSVLVSQSPWFLVVMIGGPIGFLIGLANFTATRLASKPAGGKP
jgi:hypothetical protein